MTTRPVRTASRPVDDLKWITGIGPKTEHRLQRAGVKSFAELAALSPSWLAKLIPKQSIETITTWVSDASQLATSHERIDPRPVARTKTMTRRSPRSRSRGQQSKRNERSKKTVKSSQGKDLPIRQSAEQSVAPPPLLIEENPVAAHMATQAIATQPALRLDVREMRLVPPTDNVKESLPCLGRMRAQIQFEITGPAAEVALASRHRILTQALACNLITGETTFLASHQQLLSQDSFAYTITVEFSTPKPSRYQLIGLVILPEQDVIGVTLGDLLTVVPGSSITTYAGYAQ